MPTLIGFTYFALNGSAINNQELTEAAPDDSVIAADSSAGFTYSRQIVYTGVELPPYSFVFRGHNNTTGANANFDVDQINFDILVRRDSGYANENFARIDKTTGGAEVAQLRFDASGYIAFHDATVLGAGDTPIWTSAYQTQTTDRLHVQIALTGSTGEVIIYIWTFTVDSNGHRLYTLRDYSYALTADLGADTIMRMQLGRLSNLNAAAGTATFFGAWASTGGHIQHLKGIVRRAASVATDNANWTASTGSDKAAMVDELVCDTTEVDHGTYIEHAADGNDDAITFNLTTLDISQTATIHARRNMFIIWNDAGTTGGTFKFRSVIGATTTDTTGVIPTNIVAGTGLPHGRGPFESVDPSTGLAWTYANLASEVIGVIANDEATNRTYELSTVQQIVLYDVVTTTSIRPDSTTGIDAMLSKTSPTTNAPDGTTFAIGHTGTAFQRGLFVYTLTVPAGHQIVSAVFWPNRTSTTNVPGACTLFTISGNAGNIVENQVTYNTRSTTPGAWTTPGGDSSGHSTAFIWPTVNGPFPLSAQAGTENARSGGYAAVGFIMHRNDETTADSARGSVGGCENATSGNRPLFEYTYAPSQFTPTASGGIEGAYKIIMLD